MALGNIGEYQDDNNVNTYISDDGVHFFELGVKLERSLSRLTYF